MSYYGDQHQTFRASQYQQQLQPLLPTQPPPGPPITIIPHYLSAQPPSEDQPVQLQQSHIVPSQYPIDNGPVYLNPVQQFNSDQLDHCEYLGSPEDQSPAFVDGPQLTPYPYNYIPSRVGENHDQQTGYPPQLRAAPEPYGLAQPAVLPGQALPANDRQVVGDDLGASGWYNDSATTMAGAGRPSSSDSRGRRYDIRTDVYYDAANMVLMAALELPGVKKDNLKIELATCLISRIRQVTVTAIVRPEFPFAVKPQEQLGSPLAMTSEVSAPRLLISQRRYGIYKRSYGVASHVQPEDLAAKLEDGILLLTIQCRKRFEEDRHQIAVTFL